MDNSKLLFTKTHEWVRFLDEATARIGISDYAQKELGDLVFINLPEEGDTLTAGEAFADVESVKAVSDIYSPVTGTVNKVSPELSDHPELVNSEPMDAWFVEVGNISDKQELMTEDEYKEFLQQS